VLGARYALGDGTLARTGGRVVKNVAGYALHRLLCGSRGGLAVIVEASVKLAAAPARRVALVFGVSGRELAEPARWAALPRLEPAFVTVLGREAAARLAESDGPPGDDARFRVIVGLEDDVAWVEAQAARVVETLGPPAERLEGAEVVTLAERLAGLEARAPRLTFASAHNSPAALAPLLDRPEAAGLVFHAPAGRLHLFPAAGAAQELVEAAQPHGFALIEAQGAGAPAAAPPPHSATLALRARIRAALDPGGRFATGERWAAGI
jgi:glycolate oxidase FAD binding subunit